MSDELGLKGEEVKVFLKKPDGFCYSGLIIEESQGFLVLQNSKLMRTNYLNKDNIRNIEVLK